MSATRMIHPSEYKPAINSQTVPAWAESVSLPGVMNGTNKVWRASVVWGGKSAVWVAAMGSTLRDHRQEDLPTCLMRFAVPRQLPAERVSC